MNNANKCSQCKTIIIGTYCCKCKKDIRDMPITDIFEGTPLDNIFKSFKKDKK